MSSPLPLVRREDTAGAVILTILEPRLLDEAKIQAISEQLQRVADQVGGKELILSMVDVEYLSSHMVAKLLAIQQRLQASGGKMVLSNVKPRIFATLRTANLDKVFDVRPYQEPDRTRKRGGDHNDSGATMPLG